MSNLTYPETWKGITIENITSFVGRGVGPKYLEFETGVVAINQKCIRNGKVNINFGRHHDNTASVRESAKLSTNDVCINSTGDGTIGRIGLWDKQKSSTTFFVDSHVTILRPLDNESDSKYLCELLSSEWMQNDIARYCFTGSTNQIELSRTELLKLKLYLPEVKQQNKIAKVLSTVDNLIDQTQNLIDKYTAVKQGMMADLFSRGIDLFGTPETNKNYGQLRPSFDETPELYQETDLGWVPKDWYVNSIENVSIGGFKNGYFKDPKLVGSGMKLINVTELYQEFGIDITPDKVQRIQVSPKDFEKYKVEIGDLFFTRSSLVLEGIAKSNIVRNLPEEAVFECHVMRLKPNKEIVVPEFLALFTGMPKARSYLMSMAKQVTMTTIAQPDMVGLPTPVPSLDEQTMIAQRVDAIDVLIQKEKETVEKNKNIKKGLMQDLLTGKVKVN
jgi:type I restriction enzyme S subunit